MTATTPLSFSELEVITGGKIIRIAHDAPVLALLTDSRKNADMAGAVFFAISGVHHDGHRFLSQLYRRGVRQFVLEKEPGDFRAGDVNILKVQSSLNALQKIAAHHRAQFNAPVIGITGSNGKTIVKEWLYQLLSNDFRIAKNPASYNSQLGVPLSVWQMQAHHTLGIFEAGISKPGEMENLRKVIQPTLGLFTNIGTAHDEGFANREEKIAEKLSLFRHCDAVIYCIHHDAIHQAVKRYEIPAYTWGETPEADVRISETPQGYEITTTGRAHFTLHLPFSDRASIENCLHCVAVLLRFSVPPDEIQRRVSTLRALPMRLELKEGINRCQIIDDAYSNDLAGLQVSLDFLAQQKQKSKKRLILSDILESGLAEEALARRIGELVASSPITHFTGIGPVLSAYRQVFPPGADFYLSTDEFLKARAFKEAHDEVILIKGARVFAFEKIVNQLQRKVHGTVMEIDLGALVSNLNYFKSRLKPTTRVMAMVKAFAYGSGSNEVANVLQYHKTDYLGVAYADEGVELRNNNITIPIMVMNPAEEGFDSLLRHDLEPEIYSFAILRKLLAFLQGRPCRIHIKIDTGMRRLGFDAEQLDELTTLLADQPNVQVVSVFSHLAGADESSHDDYSHGQAQRFSVLADRLSQRLGYMPIKHLLNSSGILRFPEYQFDMVRLGIGLYGIDPTEAPGNKLKPVATLKTIISQIKEVPAGESVGYGRKGKADKPLTTATIAIGYADGFSRAFGRGVGCVLIRGKRAPVIGNVCMDMTMVDVTGIPAREGDEVIIFGKDLPLQEVAARGNTIPYEILATTSERVKRIFVAESI